MKIAIMGYSGSGKSTLARELGELYHAEVLHFDAVHFLPGWEIRDKAEKQKITEDFLNTHDSWVIDGNYSKLCYERRIEEADEIVLLLFNRFACLRRAYRRYRQYKNTTRPDMAQGCNEKLDFEFSKWILWDGRKKSARERYKKIISQYGNKTVVIKNQKQLDRYRKRLADLKKHQKTNMTEEAL